MVTKPTDSGIPSYVSSVLAKIHMVTKQEEMNVDMKLGSVLAKIHMVTKLHVALIIQY